MAEESYGLQLSIKNAAGDMLNIRGSDTEELLQQVQNLVDTAKDDDLAAWIVDSYSVGEVKKAPAESSSRSSSSRSSSSRQSSNGDPSPKQIAYAKRLGVKGYSRMSKSEISAAIDEALAAQEDDDEDE